MEFFQQGDIEITETGECSTNMFDRSKTSKEEVQVGFINFIGPRSLNFVNFCHEIYFQVSSIDPTSPMVMPLVSAWSSLLEKCHHAQKIKELLISNRDKYVELKNAKQASES